MNRSLCPHIGGRKVSVLTMATAYFIFPGAGKDCAGADVLYLWEAHQSACRTPKQRPWPREPRADRLLPEE